MFSEPVEARYILIQFDGIFTGEPAIRAGLIVLQCATGEHLEGNECVQNVCFCVGGEPLTGVDCLEHQGNYCSTCDSDAGYFLDGITCNFVCTCENGTPTNGTDCPGPFSNHCQSCDSGFNILPNGQCAENQCYCNNGVGATGVNCPEDGSENCESCDTYYALKDGLCAQAATSNCDKQATLWNPPETSRSYSSIWNNDAIGTEHARSMIDGYQAWSARVNQVGQWMLIDLGENVAVGALAIQGRTTAPEYSSDYGQWVNSYIASYWMDGESEANEKFIDNGKTYTVPQQMNVNGDYNVNKFDSGVILFQKTFFTHDATNVSLSFSKNLLQPIREPAFLATGERLAAKM